MKNANETYYRRHAIYYYLFFYFIEIQVYRELSGKLEKSKRKQVIKDIRRVYKEEIPRMPYIGGKDSYLTYFLVGGVWVYALFLALKRVEIENEQAGQVLFNVTSRGMHLIPRFIRSLATRFILGETNINRYRKLDEYTSRREFPVNWVLKFVEGDGKDFVYGVDYIECGLCKYFKLKGFENYSKYICVFDFAFYNGLPGIRLTRTQTLAEGYPVCDYRFYRDNTKK